MLQTNWTQTFMFFLYDAVYLLINAIYLYMMLSTCTSVRSIRLLLKVIRTTETAASFATRLLDSVLPVGFQKQT